MSLASILVILSLSVDPSVGQTAATDVLDWPPGVDREMVDRGKVLFHGDGLCVACHGRGATGAIGPDLTDGDWLHDRGSYLSILSVVLSGVPAARSTRGIAMPARGGADLADEDVRAVAAYVWGMSHTSHDHSLPEGITAEHVARGREVFAGIGKCSTCHGDQGQGLVGPSLTDDQWLHARGSYLAITRTILTGVPAERAVGGVPMPARGGAPLTDDEVSAIAAYVWSVSRVVDHAED